MTTRLQWLLLNVSRQLWVRSAGFCVLAIATALVAVWVKRYIPADMPTKIGANAVDSLLNILAVSMLSVTIFSLSTLVAALGAATNNVTPRATRLLSEDKTSQNALATFLGTFLFSLVGIIALQTGLYGSRGRVVLYVVTIAVIGVIVVTLLRWIHHVTTLGRVGTTTDRVEDAATEAMRRQRRSPYFGGMPLTDDDRIPDDAVPVYAGRMGYVAHLDMEALSGACTAPAHRIYVRSLPGAYASPERPLALVQGPVGEDTVKVVRKAFTVGNGRSYDQDPRFGASVLSEIASRALSPAMNDPGTAIDVLGRAVRILSIWADPVDETAKVEHPQIHVPPIRVDDLFDDVFTPIARDGAGIIEVSLRLQKALRILSLFGEPYASAAARHSRLALERSEQAMTLQDDLRRVRQVSADVCASRD